MEGFRWARLAIRRNFYEALCSVLPLLAREVVPANLAGIVISRT